MTNDFETFGAHIRNILGPYANIVSMLEDLADPNTDLKHKNIILNYLRSDKLLKNAQENLKHFKEFSYLDELENLNWRATKLYEEYCKRNKE